MNYTTRFLLIVSVSLLAVCYAFPQATEISEKDVNAIIERATTATNSLVRREKALSETFDDKASPPKSTIVFTRTIISPDKTQTYYSSENASRKHVSETINLGSNVYIREDGGVWKLETQEERDSYPAPPKAMPFPALRDQTTTAKRSKVSLDTRVTDLYEIETKGTKTDRSGTYTRVNITRHWINSDGTLAKLQTETYTSNSTGLFRRTVIYEYDPNLTIEAPIIK